MFFVIYLLTRRYFINYHHLHFSQVILLSPVYYGNKLVSSLPTWYLNILLSYLFSYFFIYSINLKECGLDLSFTAGGSHSIYYGTFFKKSDVKLLFRLQNSVWHACMCVCVFMSAKWCISQDKEFLGSLFLHLFFFILIISVLSL
jgi:hypothetical protein